MIELVELDFIQMHKGGETLPQKILLSPPWVGYFLRKILRWYVEKYRKEACTEMKDDRIKSYIIIRNLPYSLLIPKTTSIKLEGERLIQTLKLNGIRINSIVEDASVHTWDKN